jgi:Protein of unknown function (DUF753)
MCSTTIGRVNCRKLYPGPGLYYQDNWCEELKKPTNDILWMSNFHSISDDGHTQRGCLELEPRAFCNETNRCSLGYVSNRKIYPVNRLRCLQCDDGERYCREPPVGKTGLSCLYDVPDNECYQSFKDGKSESFFIG